LIVQGVMAVLVVGLIGSASSLRGWRWQYALTGVFVSTYLAYHLGGKFLNALGWIGVLETSGVNVSDVYGDLFWFGLGTTICYLLVILVLRRSYGKLASPRTSSEQELRVDSISLFPVRTRIDLHRHRKHS